MRNLLFRVCTVILSSLFLCSCGKDVIASPEDPVDDPATNFDGYKIKDTIGLDKESLFYTDVYADSTFILGLKDRKIWVGCFNSNTKEQLNEWNGIEQVPDSIKKFRNVHFTTTTNGYICLAGFGTDSGNACGILLSLSNKDNTAKYVNFNHYYDNYQIYNDAIYIYGSLINELYSLDGTMIISSVSKYTTGDSTFFSGFYNDKVRFRLYNEQTKEQMQEWKGQETFDRNIKIYEGYGEYSNYYVDALILRLSNSYNLQPKIINTSWGIAVVPDYQQKDSDHFIVGDIFFLNGNKAVCYHLSENTWRSNTDIKKWYKESILMQTSEPIEGRKSIVFSPEGIVIEKLTSIDPDPMIMIDNNLIIPISYIEGIRIGRRSDFPKDNKTYIHRVNCKTGETVWSTLIEAINDVKEYNCRWSIVLIDDSTNNWIYQIEIIFYDGSKRQTKFSINIDTGEIKYL